MILVRDSHSLYYSREPKWHSNPLEHKQSCSASDSALAPPQRRRKSFMQASPRRDMSPDIEQRHAKDGSGVAELLNLQSKKQLKVMLRKQERLHKVIEEICGQRSLEAVGMLPQHNTHFSTRQLKSTQNITHNTTPQLNTTHTTAPHESTQNATSNSSHYSEFNGDGGCDVKAWRLHASLRTNR